MLLDTNLGGLLIKILLRAKQFFSAIWNGNYEIFEKSLWGISLLDIVGLIVATIMVVNFIKFFFTIFAELGKETLKKIFNKLLVFDQNRYDG